jgi:hypothetical protein
MPINGPLLGTSKVIPNVAVFAEESEYYAALLLNAQQARGMVKGSLGCIRVPTAINKLFMRQYLQIMARRQVFQA